VRRAAALLVGLAAASPVCTAGAAPLRGEVVGQSVEHRPIRVVRVGDPDAPRKVLVVGCIHGTERAGIAITRALRLAEPPHGVQLLVLDRLNPDGCTNGTRGNAHGVDLNRNFFWGWRPLDGLFESGPRPSSEPETRAAMALILRERPTATIWYHQHLDWVDLQRGSSLRLMRRYARASGLRAVRTSLLPGTVARWQIHRLPGHTAFVVELPAGALPAAAVARHVGAVLAVAGEIAPGHTAST
jgi:protein MpaA